MIRSLFCFFVVASCCATPLIAQEKFVTIASGTTEMLYGVQFISRDTGFVIGSNGLFMSTADGGLSWRQVRVEHPRDSAREWWYDMHFHDAMHGMIVGSLREYSRAMSRPILATTTNGGFDWKTEVLDDTGIFLQVQFLDRQKAYLLKRPVIEGPGDIKLFYTSTGGESLTKWDFRYQNFKEYERSMTSIFFYNELEGRATPGLHATFPFDSMMRTSDGGKSWSRFANGDSAKRGSQPGSLQQFGEVLLATDFGTVYISRDSGASFTWVTSGEVIAVANDSTAFSAEAAGETLMYRTVDTGRTWRWIQVEGDAGDVYGISALDATTAYVVGGKGMILKLVGSPVQRVERESARSFTAKRVAGSVLCSGDEISVGDLVNVYDALGRLTASTTAENKGTATIKESLLPGYYTIQLARTGSVAAVVL